ncbi:hypothetical protein BH23CHL2_BH23CHL2_05910 [soil metagenome]
MSTDIVLTCTDPQERVIRLEQYRWEQKCRVHPELVGNLQSVEQTLTQPEAITADANFANRECYYLKGALPRKRREFLKVVVEFDSETDTGRVITAYSVTRLPSPEEEARL